MRKNIFFDLDGTLTDPQEGIIRCIQFALEKVGQPAPSAPELIWCIGPPLHESFARLVPAASEEEVWKFVGYYRERFATVGMFENGVYPGIAELVEGLARRHTLFVATSKPEVFATKIMNHYGLAKHFRRVYGSELDGTRSDKGELIGYLLTEEKILPADALIIGDRKHDVLGAKKAGILSVGVTWGYGSDEELRAAGANFIVKDLPSLERLLAGEAATATD